MSKQILFIQGAGEGAHDEDEQLVRSLRRALGADYEVLYPTMPDEADAPYEEWSQYIEATIDKMHKPIFLVAHSVGGSVLAKYLSETSVKKSIACVFLVAAPFWGGDGWRYEGYEELELPIDFVHKLPKKMPVFLYQCRDDKIVPYEHLALYKKLLPGATARQLNDGGHQLNNNLAVVARDIKALSEPNSLTTASL